MLVSTKGTELNSASYQPETELSIAPPPILTKDRLNEKELKVATVLSEDLNAMPLNALAAMSFPEQEARKANSWVRNSLRKLVRGEWVERTGKGTYRLTDTGRVGLNG